MIVCLGWGSLIWDPRDLPVGEWKPDGPSVNVEFVRQSGRKRDRLTLVLFDVAEPVPSLWARMTVDNLNGAVSDLAHREGTFQENIGHWSRGQADPKKIPGLGVWATSRDIDHVIWTALGQKFKGKDGRAPTEDEAVAYLKKLDDEGRAAKAKEYVRRAPPQIDTAYRGRIERCLGWTPHA